MRGVVLEREVVDRDHSRARRAERDRVLRVHERSADAPEQAGQRPEHPCLLDVRTQSERLDPVGRSSGLRVTAAIRRPDSAAPELPEQVEDVGLVAGALPTEHVGIDDDERVAHPIAFRYPATAASTARSHV